jgi:hypothetical protein
LGITNVSNDITNDFVRGIKAEGRRVANILFYDALTFFFKTISLFKYGSANVVANITQLV